MALTIAQYWKGVLFLAALTLFGIMIVLTMYPTRLRHGYTIQSKIHDATVDRLPCEFSEAVQNGVPWPNCADKIFWMKTSWESDLCFATEGVNGSICSITTYLAEKEKACPPTASMTPTVYPDFFEGGIAVPRTNLSAVIADFEGMKNLLWVKNRLKVMKELWENSTSTLFSGTLKNFPRKKKRILIHMGLLELGMGAAALKGGPLGELVQWSDIIASLYMLGHEIVVTRSKQELMLTYADYFRQGVMSGTCRVLSTEYKFPFDIVYTDIHGYLEMPAALKDRSDTRCRFRIVDSFGTEAIFNAAVRGRQNPYGGLMLDLRQFNTMFPHSPDNTFLGFVVENPVMYGYSSQKIPAHDEDTKREIALVYGKDASFWAKSTKYLNIIKEYVSEVHGTVGEEGVESIPDYIVNHGVLSIPELFNLLRRTKIFIGLGFPFEGPAPLEAIAMGAIFINPKFDEPISSENHEFYMNKPTRRGIDSQNPYSEKYIGKPHVFTIDIENEVELRAALKEIKETRNHTSYLPYEFSAAGMLERVAVQVEKQNLCDKFLHSFPNVKSAALWPPLSSLQAVRAPDATSSCNEACERKGLRCEQSYFSFVNRPVTFATLGIRCKSENYAQIHRTDYPAYDELSGTCFFQSHDLYFSCANSQTNFIRICPCRDFRRYQVALCEDCIF